MSIYQFRIAGAVLLLAFSVAAVVAQVPGNPDNWCRQGFFTLDSREFGVSVVKGKKSTKAFFYGDDNEQCPGSASCRTRSYVVSGDWVITNRKRGDYVCSWFAQLKGAPTVGWLKLSDLDSPPVLSIAGANVWVGEWKYADNDIIFAPANVPGTLSVKGTAFWKGLGDNIHIGELDGVAKYDADKLEYADGNGEYDCRASMQLVTGRFLIVADNMNCGGMNVTFSGIYLKSAAKRTKN